MSFSREPTALIVDDDFMFIMHASAIVADAGYRPMEVPNAAQALTLLEAEDGKIEVLFVDVQLPGMNGIDLARIVSDRWPEITIFVASGYVNSVPLELAGKATFFPKPLDVQAVRAALERGKADRKPGMD